MRYLNIILLSLIIISCKNDNSFVVKGKVLDKKSGIVRLNQIGANNFDSKICELTNGEFYFEGEVSLPEEYFIQYKDKEESRSGSRYYKFFVEPGSKTQIILNTENINKSTFKGSKIGNEYYRLKQEIYTEFEINVEKLISEYEKAEESSDKERLGKIVQKLDSITKKIQERELRYIWNHPNSYISAVLLYSQQQELNMDTLQKYFYRLDKSLCESKYYINLKTSMPLQIGKPYLEFELPDSVGTIHRFSTVAKNKVTLIDFWYSGCSPCRIHNRELSTLYEKHKASGFEIVGVSTDRNTSDFIKAIKEDEMTWLNLLDNTNKESIGKLYGSNTVPFNVLIDRNGLIAYKANDYDNLKTVVDSLMKIK